MSYILFITNNFPETTDDKYYGTMSVIVAETIDYLVDLGFYIVIVSLYGGRKKSIAPFTNWKYGEVPVIQLNGFNKTDNTVDRNKKKLDILRLYLNFKFGRPFVAQFHNCIHSGIVGQYLARRLRIRYFITEHYSWFKTKKLSLELLNNCKKVFECAEASVSVSDSLRHDLVKTLNLEKIRIKVIPNFVEDNFLNCNISSKRFDGAITLLHVSKLDKKKDQALLLKAFALARKEFKQLELRIIGKGPMRNELEKMVQELGIENAVHFDGYKSHLELVEYYRNAHLYVSASPYETFAIPVFEAMACGVPVLISECGGPTPFINERNGKIVETRSAPDFSAGIKEMILNLRDFNPYEIRHGVQKYFKKKSILDQYVSLYNEVSHGQ